MASGAGTVRAHGSKSQDTGAGAGGVPGVLGVRREDKNKWERRAPVAPRHVRELVAKGLKVIVQPSTRRVFTDEEYREAGAVVQEDLSECATIAGVKEVPIDLLLPNRTWCFFSHTIKGQPTGMPLLDAVLEKKVRLVDYECITETGLRGGPRLVAFGAYAGYAGAIDFLRGLGERFLALGFSTPLLHIGSAFMYPSLEEAQRAVAMAGDAIRTKGLPEALCPFTAVFTGTGNVSRGALDIFRLLPFEMVEPSQLPHLCSQPKDCRKVYLSVVVAEHMVRRRDGGPFDKESYYHEPARYESVFQDTVLPYSTVIVNGMYWDARFPRLFTYEDLNRHVINGNDKLLGVCDITCDADGSVPTRQFTSIEQPFFIFNALTEETTDCLDEPGVLFHAVDHLPSELPREASEHFGNCLLAFLPALAASRAPVAPGRGDTQALPPPVRGAVVTEGGQLTRDYEYITQLRSVNQRADAEAAGAEEDKSAAFHGPHNIHQPPACMKLDFAGHLFDTRVVNRIFDTVEAARARAEILNIEVGSTKGDESNLSIMVMAQSQDRLLEVVEQIKKVAADAKVAMWKSTSGRVADTAAAAAKPERSLALAPASRLSVLVLGAGFVSAPLIEYLLRRPENSLIVASMVQSEVDAMAQRYGPNVRPEVLDITSPQESAREAREALVKEADLIVSLVPATLHVGIARLAILHRKPMVTASYVSEEMQSLDAEANAAGVLIINEVGLDPGIDHMSAMKMIDAATAGGQGRVLGFSSLCGGLPAPEAAGSSPLGYKFSWSPKGVLLAARNAARFRHEGQLYEVPGDDLLAHSKPMTLNNAFAFDVLPNRDSTAFAKLYGLADAPSFYRGTLRYQGFCQRMLALARLGLLESGPRAELKAAADERLPLCKWLARLLGASPADGKPALREAVRSRLGSDCAQLGLEFVTWLGLLGDEPVPEDIPADSPVDVVAQLLQRQEMAYQPGERDMVVMRHELTVERSDGALEKRVATLVEYGEPKGHTAMARTVGLTAAICAQLVLDSPQRFGVGVQRPLRAEWYEPVLRVLEGEGIAMEERTEILREAQASGVGSGSRGAAPVFAAKL